MRCWSISSPIGRLGACLFFGVLAGACAPARPGAGPTPQTADSTARAAIASERMIDPGTFPVGAVGVPPMIVTSGDTTLAALSYGLAELLANDLARSARLTVVERVRIDAVLRELRLSSNGAVDSASGVRVGRLVGARRLIIGGVHELPGGDVQITAQVADVVTGQVVNAVSARAPLARLFEAESALAFQIFDALGVTLTPAERAAIEAAPTRNIAALLAYSRGVRDESFGRYGAAAEEYRAALRADPNFTEATARMTRLEGRSADATRLDDRTSVASSAVNTESASGHLPGVGNGGGGRGRGASRAAHAVAANVNPSLAELTRGGAASAVAVGSTPTLGPVHGRLVVTIVIFIRPSK